MVDNSVFIGLVSSPPRDLPAAVSHVAEAIAETGVCACYLVLFLFAHLDRSLRAQG